jgi:hypothetical protein
MDNVYPSAGWETVFDELLEGWIRNAGDRASLWSGSRIASARARQDLALTVGPSEVAIVLSGYYFAESIDEAGDSPRLSTIFRVGGPGDLLYEIEQLRRLMPAKISRLYEASRARRVAANHVTVAIWNGKEFMDKLESNPELMLFLALQVCHKMLEESAFTRITRAPTVALACTDLAMHLQGRWGPERTAWTPFTITKKLFARILRHVDTSLPAHLGTKQKWPTEGEWGNLSIRPIIELVQLRQQLVEDAKIARQGADMARRAGKQKKEAQRYRQGEEPLSDTSSPLAGADSLGLAVTVETRVDAPS